MDSATGPGHRRKRSASQPLFATPKLLDSPSSLRRASSAPSKHRVGFSDTVQVVLIPQSPADVAFKKALWWDMDTFAANAREVLAERAAEAVVKATAKAAAEAVIPVNVKAVVEATVEAAVANASPGAHTVYESWTTSEDSSDDDDVAIPAREGLLRPSPATPIGDF